MHLNGTFWKDDILKTVEDKVIIITRYVQPKNSFDQNLMNLCHNVSLNKINPWLTLGKTKFLGPNFEILICNLDGIFPIFMKSVRNFSLYNPELVWNLVKSSQNLGHLAKVKKKKQKKANSVYNFENTVLIQSSWNSLGKCFHNNFT